LGIEKLVEMTAMSRDDETCPDVPREWSAAFVILLMKSPPSEEEVEAQERDTLALRKRIGRAKWCQLYSVEMQEAYLIFQMLLQRKSPQALIWNSGLITQKDSSFSTASSFVQAR
jgi:hypothetical protein